jgi:protein TonB
MKLLFLVAFLFFSIVEIQAQEKPAADTITVGNIVFEKVEILTGATMAEWRRLLEIYLVPVIKKARKKMEAGKYTINVRFLKEKDGSINSVKALNDPGYGLVEAAEKVVNQGPNGPKWKVIEPNSNKVRSYHTQQITFTIEKK